MRVVAFDFETALIEPGLLAPPPVCMSVDDGSEPTALYSYAEAPGILKPLLEDPGVLLVGANTPYDLAVAANADPSLLPLIFDAYDADRIADVQTRQKLIDIALGEYRQHGRYSLAALVKRLCNRELAKEDTWRLRYWELVDIPLEDWPQDAIDYSKDDAIATLEVYQTQLHNLIEVERECVLADEFRQGRAHFALHLASAWGLRTDAEGVALLRSQCEARLQDLEGELLKAGLLKQDKKGKISRSVRKAQARMLEINPEARLTEKGQELKKKQELPDDTAELIKYISVDSEACEDSGDWLLEMYTEYSQTKSLLSGHVVAMEKGIHEPIHTRFEVLLKTGRTSSSDPNTQNVRRAPGARECFIPRPGNVYLDCDYDKAELHTLAQVCINLFGHSNLADTLIEGIDPHARLGARLAHTTYEDLVRRIYEGDEEAAEWRQRAKPGNFGFPGGMGPEGMMRYAKKAYGVVLTMEEAEYLYRGWQEEYPEVAFDYLGWIRQLTRHTGRTTIEHFGSKRWRGNIPYRTAANSFFQGMSADGMKEALWQVTKKCYTPGTPLYGYRVVNEIHDELLLEGPEEGAPEAAIELQTTMVEGYNIYTPDVPVKATAVICDRWSKKAKPVHDENGRLQVWRYAA
jgi:DNA polymerase I-like protein with 3'-5' exonuclease and polymerase domains